MMQLQGSRFVDLSHPFNNSMPAAGLPAWTHEFFSRVGAEGRLHNLDRISFCPHTGTHMDAPFHVDNDWPSLEQLDPAILIGPALRVRLQIPNGTDYAIHAADIRGWEAAHEPIRPGDAVLFCTGHADKWELGPDAFIGAGYPYLAPDAAEYLAERQIRFVGMESISVDTFSTESHRILLGRGIIVVENLCHLEQLPDRCSTIGTFPAYEGATGTQIRLLALVD